MTDNRNLILAIVLSVVIIFGFQYVFEAIYPQPETPAQREPGNVPGDVSAPDKSTMASPGEPQVAVPQVDTSPAPAQGLSGPVSAVKSRSDLIAQSPRVRINTPRLHGSISLISGRIDDLTLADYHETTDPNSPEIVLFSPAGSAQAYFAQVGWAGASSTGQSIPDAATEWTADRQTLTPDAPVTLSWTNEAGVTFERIFSVDNNYLFTVKQRIVNQSSTSVSLNPYTLVSRSDTPHTKQYYILHEGPLGVFNDQLKEVNYSDLQEAGSIAQKSRGGWIGFTDKYWLAAAIPDYDEEIASRFLFEKFNERDRYQVDFVGPTYTVAPGQSASAESRVFVGAKEVRLLDKYSEEYKIERFDRAIDFGWFYFLTKPLFYFLIFIHEHVGNFGIAILLLTVTIKLLFFPLANKSYKAMSQMRKLQPEITKMKERFGDDRARFNQEMMALYKREKVNPASGCLPIVIQIPVFFALYKVLFVTIEMRHAPFFGWIHDLSAPDPTSIWNVFGLISYDPATIIPQVLNIGAWPLIMGLSMWLQQRLNPQPPDPIQAKIFMFLPLVFTFLLAHFPAGLVIYWAWNNSLSILQQWVIMRRMGVKV